MSTVFAKRSLLFTASGASLLLASFFSGIVIARLLGSEGSGSVVFALWLASVIAPMIGGGMWAAVGRTLPDLRGRGDAIQAFAMSGWLSRRLLAYVIIAVLGFFAVVWISPGWVERIAQSATMGTESNGLVMLLLLPALVIAQVLSAFGNNYLRGEQEFDRLARRSGWSLRVASYLRWAWRRPMGHSWRYRRIYSRSGTTGAHNAGIARSRWEDRA